MDNLTSNEEIEKKAQATANEIWNQSGKHTLSDLDAILIRFGTDIYNLALQRAEEVSEWNNWERIRALKL